MITFPNAKINLGLNIVEKRPDGYHNLETIFYPIAVKDALEIVASANTCNNDFNLSITGNSVDGEVKDNLVVKAYHLLKSEFELPPLDIYLYKHIPSGAGLGGGSADAAFMLKMLNEKFNLNLSEEKLIEYAVLLGADCAFFIKNEPVFASGIGNIFSPIEINLSSYYIFLIKPNIFVSTREAFSNIKPHYPEHSLKDIIKKPVSEWKEYMVNDFEETVFGYHPTIKEIKEELYSQGASYASMSGSGSSVYGIFENEPEIPLEKFPDSFIWQGKLAL